MQPHINTITHNPSSICTPPAMTPWTLSLLATEMEERLMRKKSKEHLQVEGRAA
jgi:hypothetical protein